MGTNRKARRAQQRALAKASSRRTRSAKRRGVRRVVNESALFEQHQSLGLRASREAA